MISRKWIRNNSECKGCREGKDNKYYKHEASYLSCQYRISKTLFRCMCQTCLVKIVCTEPCEIYIAKYKPKHIRKESRGGLLL